ncbi:LysR family transcriptional regulator [Roseovarius sp. EL26]|uniref:LysR family transcriptional regulator n=1 Tax=Roseovarius sp. EL26 TaxID=2126672 RepID=UPI000EA4047B|nr:LysR family transcriptional regulator [Roseovarius sp. EL26]
MSDDLRLSLRALRAFATVVEQGSISAAAKVLNIAPSAIGAALDQVETEFGADLLVRTRARGIAATAEGIEVAARFRALLEDYAELMDAGRDLGQSLSGTLRIGYYAPVAPAFLPQILCPMMAANPGLTLELKEHDNDSAQEALLAGALDVILFAGHDLRRGIETELLLELPPYVLAPEGHEITRQVPVPVKALADYPLVQLDLPLARPYLDRLFQSAGIAPKVAVRASSTEMVRGMVGAGAGVSVLAMRPMINVSYGGDRLVTVPLEPDVPQLQLLSGRVSGRPRKLVSVFLQILHGWMQSEAAGELTVGVGSHAG